MIKFRKSCHKEDYYGLYQANTWRLYDITQPKNHKNYLLSDHKIVKLTIMINELKRYK